MEQLRLKQLNKMLKEEDGDSGSYMKQMMEMSMMKQFMGENKANEPQEDQMYNKMTRMYGMKMLQKEMSGGGQENMEMQRLRDEIRNMTNNAEDPRVQEMQRIMDKLEDRRRLEDIVKAMAQSGGSKTEMLDTIKVIQDVKGQTDAKLEKARDEYHKTLDGIRDSQIADLKMEILKARDNTSPIAKRIETSAQELVMDTVDKGFKAAKGEKSTGEIATDLITGVAEKIREPILEPLGQALAQKAAGMPAPGPVAQAATPGQDVPSEMGGLPTFPEDAPVAAPAPEPVNPAASFVPEGNPL